MSKNDISNIDFHIISPENQNFYNISITLHGLLMIFFLVMPGLFGGFGMLINITWSARISVTKAQDGKMHNIIPIRIIPTIT